jgi:DNA-binding LacI/PurR family transcriptional regulator
VPTVLMGTYVAGMPFDVITLDEAAAGRLAMNRLLQLGHRRVAVMAGRSGVSTNEERLIGCRLACAEYGFDLADDRIVTANFSEEQAFDETRRLLSRREKPTAIISLSNLMTIGVMRGLVAKGLTSPSDVAIVGIDDFEWAEIMNPRPTTIAQPIVEMAGVAISMLLDQIKTGGRPAGRRHCFAPKLVVRASCGAPVDLPTPRLK